MIAPLVTGHLRQFFKGNYAKNPEMFVRNFKKCLSDWCFDLFCFVNNQTWASEMLGWGEGGSLPNNSLWLIPVKIPALTREGLAYYEPLYQLTYWPIDPLRSSTKWFLARRPSLQNLNFSE